MKKIVFLSPRYWPAVGGVERHVAKIVRELTSRDCQITILTTSHDSQLPATETIGGAIVHRLPTQFFNKKLPTWQWLWSKRQILADADVIHIHDVFWWYLPLVFFFARRKVFTTFHGYEGSGLPRWQAIWQRRLAEKLSHKTIAVGDFIRKWYGQKPDLIIYGAVEVSPSSAKKFAPNPDTACFIGRLQSDTGIEMYLQALPLIKRKIKLTVFGEGELAASLRQQISKHRLPVQLHGFTNQPIMQLKKHRFAFVSRYLSIIEAMSCKRLVVATYANAIKKDYLTYHPMAKNMIIAGSPAELTEKINHLTKVKEKLMVETAYRWAKKQTWQKLASHYLKLWQT